ncbi:MAG TPA: hypothetical protein VF633_10505 [Brevundimonas sp.]|jgi:hypothetical protein
MLNVLLLSPSKKFRFLTLLRRVPNAARLRRLRVVEDAMASRVLRLLSSFTLACGIAAVSTVGLAGFWKLIGGGALTIHGWIAMGLGILGTVGISWVLMGLAFRSDREGWDDRVDNSLDPGRETHGESKDDDLIY